MEYTRRRAQRFGPKPLPENLPRIVERVDPPEEERRCACCRKCMNRDVVKELPPRVIQKGRPSPSLLAYIVIAKYLDHMPLYRQEQIFKRHGVQLVRSTIDEWLGELSHLLLPIVSAMKRRFSAEPYLQCDETPIQALEHEGRGKKKAKGKDRKKQVRRCYLWAYSIPRDEVIYDVTASRSARGPCAMLEEFSGTLQTDGYAGYNELFASGERLRVACMAHIRRKFVEARHALPGRVDEIIDLIRDLYSIEEESRQRELDPQGRLALRHEKSRPVFSALKSAIDELAAHRQSRFAELTPRCWKEARPAFGLPAPS